MKIKLGLGEAQHSKSPKQPLKLWVYDLQDIKLSLDTLEIIKKSFSWLDEFFNLLEKVGEILFWTKIISKLISKISFFRRSRFNSIFDTWHVSIKLNWF